MSGIPLVCTLRMRRLQWRSQGMEDLIAALVARRFYLEQRTKMQIADEMGISRFRVARILDRALRDGIVRITVAVPPAVDLALSARLTAAIGVRQALVVREPAHLGPACAALLAERLTEDDVLGVSWGRTLHELTAVLPALPRAEVVQIVGSVPSADLNVNSLELLRRLSESTGGRVHALHAPMILDSPAVAASLRATASVASTLAAFPRLTCALVGIGAWQPGGSSLRSALPADLVATLDAAGAVADICSTVLAADGSIVGGDAVPSRCVAITTEELRAVPDVIALAGGAGKAAAIAAAVRAGLIHRLITDATVAEILIH
jgi:DNA-binding transcriptional regulator LsrR (DeoR family)